MAHFQCSAAERGREVLKYAARAAASAVPHVGAATLLGFYARHAWIDRLLGDSFDHLVLGIVHYHRYGIVADVTRVGRGRAQQRRYQQ
jgi:hypothetical protein